MADTKAFAEKVNTRAAEYAALAGELGELAKSKAPAASKAKASSDKASPVAETAKAAPAKTALAAQTDSKAAPAAAKKKAPAKEDHCQVQLMAIAATSLTLHQRALLLQIIVEQEQSSGQPILTELLLVQLIRFYGNPMQAMMAEYFQKSVRTFVNQQRSVRTQMQDMLTNTPIDTMRGLVTKNMKTWEAMFMPKGENSDDNREQTKNNSDFRNAWQAFYSFP